MAGTFDALADQYDQAFTHTAIGTYLRSQVHERLRLNFAPGSHILEMGCGTGEDALLLGQRGLNVIATDASPAMLNITRAKTRHLASVTVQPLDLRALDAATLPAFDVAFSNFGAFNCLTDWRPLANWLAQHIPAGGKVCLGIMAPFCLWEFAWHGLHLEFDVTLRRLRGSSFQPDDRAEAIPVTYPTVRRMTRDFTPHFRRSYVQPLGLFLPPSDVYGVIEKRPRLLRLLLAAERCFGKISALALFADHYWIEFERTESQP